MSNDPVRIDRGRVTLLLSALTLSVLAALYLGKPFATDSEVLVGTAGVSATFAGFIIAVKTLLGDPSTLFPGSWRLGVVQSRDIERRSARLTMLFGLYVLSTFGCLAFATFSDSVKRVPLADASLAFLVSFTAIMTLEIPKSLRGIQSERIEAAIRARRKDVGKGNGGAP
jgi:hypothetical protein